MRQRKTTLLLIVIILCSIIPLRARVLAEAPSPTSTSVYATADPFQRKSFYAAGRHWIWYSDGANLVFRSALDDLEWSEATSVGVCAHGVYASVFFDGTFVHYIRYLTYDFFYRRGTPQSDGTINWSAVEQLVYDGTSTDRFGSPMIAVDSGGYAWIGASYRDGVNILPKVLKNENLDGTWSMADGFPYQLNAVSEVWYVAITPLMNQWVYVTYGHSIGIARGRLYNGSWGDEEIDLGESEVRFFSSISVTSKGDDVHFAYTKVYPYKICYNKRTYGVGWQAADELVQDSVSGDTAPVLSIDTATGDVYCFWAGTPTADHIYYKKRVSGVWDADPTDWIDESTYHLTGDDLLTCFYQDYGCYIGLLYVTKLASPYNVRFKFFCTRAPQDPKLLFGAGFNASSPYVELHWNHSLLNVPFFEVQNSSDGESWDYLGQSTTTNYTDIQVVNGTKRYYKVRACNQTDSTWYNSSFSDVNFEKVYFILEIGDGVVGAGFPPEALIMLIFLLSIAFIWLYGVSRKK